jgi:putative hemolysin
LLSGIISEAAFSDGVSMWLQGLGTTARAASISCTAIVVVAVYVTIVFGELVPKRIGSFVYPETVARLVPAHDVGKAAVYSSGCRSAPCGAQA